MPSTLETAKRFLSQVLHRIHFEYVPAVKERAYYSHLLSTLQERLLNTPLDRSAAPLVGDLASHIQGQVGQLQNDFKRATNLDTFIEPPAELASLFQSFLVSTTSGGGPIPLVMRGDGMQARYVPSVLHYISSRSHDFFIWGFEEPENSLEYFRITSLANDFEQTYSKEAQIFITSHSPTLISLRTETTACYRAFKKDDSTSIVQVWPESASEHGELLLNELGMMEIQKEIHQQYTRKIMELESLSIQVKQLKNDLAEYGKPLLIVEGKYDKAIIETVWAKLYRVDPPFIIRVADPAVGDEGGAAGAQSVKLMIEALHPEEGRKAIGLFDRDEQGIKCFGELSKNFRSIQGSQDKKKHRNGLSFAILLPVPDYRSKYLDTKNMTIEFMFPDEVIHRKTNDGRGLDFSIPELFVIAGKRRISIQKEAAMQLQLDLIGYETINSGKDVFIEEIIPGCTPEECQSFNVLFSIVLDLLGIHVD